METDVVISNQYNQFCVSWVPEHPVEASHVVLPVLQRHNDTNTAEAGPLIIRRGEQKLPWEADES